MGKMLTFVHEKKLKLIIERQTPLLKLLHVIGNLKWMKLIKTITTITLLMIIMIMIRKTTQTRGFFTKTRDKKNPV